MVILLFFGALFWAKRRDPFSRNWFSLKTTDYGSFQCVTVLPKPLRERPVVIYAHGSGGTLTNDGNDLRQMAELGLGVLSLEFNQTNQSAFDQQFGAVLRYLGQQSWARTNAVAWVGFSQGANWSLDYACQHPDQQPELLVQLSGAGLPAGQTNSRLASLHCATLLIHGTGDQIFPALDTERLGSWLQSKHLATDLKIVSGVPHGMEPERGVIFRSIGEYCLRQLAGKDAWQNYRSIAQWQADAPALWKFLIPAAAWALWWAGCWFWRKFSTPDGFDVSRSQLALWWLAVIMAFWAVGKTVLHQAPPHYPVSDQTLSIARRYLIEPRESADFEFLAAQPIWGNDNLKTLLEHVELSSHNREVINWQLEQKTYEDFVLSPGITGKANEDLNWRRPLWEEFYPLVRHASSPAEAARIVARHLRERVTVAELPTAPREVPEIWLRQITDRAGFEVIYVAALRSVGVPARLTKEKTAEYWDGKDWQAAPRPVLETWLETEK